MGAPKQKWTAEEEAALKAGVCKHGAGKWQTILRDPDFSDVLRARSNVDLKDKWRNINVTLSGLGSREKARLALKRNPQVQKLEDKVTLVRNGGDENVTEAKPVAPSETVRVADAKKTYTRLDSLILDAIAALKEPKGSDRNAIAMYIEEQYCTPANFSKLLVSKLKFLIASGQLLKVKHRYRISSTLPLTGKSTSTALERKLVELPTSPRKELKILTRPQVNADLKMMEGMQADEAAAIAARFVAEAEAAVAEAEKAAREADAADVEKEAAEVFAEAAAKALRCRQLRAC